MHLAHKRQRDALGSTGHSPTQVATDMLKSSQMSADLVPREVAEKWLTYLRAELPTVAFKCSTQKQVGSFCHNSYCAAPRVGLEGGGAPQPCGTAAATHCEGCAAVAVSAPDHT